jgi:nitrate reductase NapE component
MSEFEIFIFALLWLVFSVALVMGFGYFLVWLDVRKLRRKAR